MGARNAKRAGASIHLILMLEQRDCCDSMLYKLSMEIFYYRSLLAFGQTDHNLVRAKGWYLHKQVRSKEPRK